MASEFNYVKSQRTADKLISKFGGKFKGRIIRPTKGNGPPSNPGVGTPVEIICTCVAVEYTIQERTVGTIQEKAKRILVSPIGLPTGFEFQPTDKIRTADGTVYSIVPPVSAFKPTTIVVFFDVQGVT